MRRVNIAEAKTYLSSLVDSVLRGEEVVIARRNRPLVRLEALASARGKRRLGWARGQVELSPDFDETPADFSEYVHPARTTEPRR